MLTLLWRDRFLMLAIFAVLFLIGAAVAFTMKTQYSAQSSILVRLGQEYVYNPGVGDAARGAIPTTDQLVQSEVEILSSLELRRRVLEDLGVGRVLPDLASKYAHADAAKQQEILDAAAGAMGANLKVISAPDTAVIRLAYSDTDPARAALVLNKLLDEYVVYRQRVLLGGDGSGVDKQLQLFQRRLDQTNAAYQAFLAKNDIDDFEAEKASLNSLQSSLTDENFRVQARLKEIDGRLAEIAKQVGKLSPEISLYHDTNPAASDKLLQLQIQRQDLLSRYRPDAQPVRQLDQQIVQLQALQAQAGQTAGARRIGVNPVYQTVQTEQLQLTAEGASLRQRQAAIAQQLKEISARRQKLTELEPQYQAFQRDLDLLQNNVKTLAQKHQEEQANQVSQRVGSSISIVERPTPPAHGKSLKAPVLALAFLFACFTAMCAGLVHVFLRRGFPTPDSAARTLDLPVLATAGLKAG